MIFCFIHRLLLYPVVPVLGVTVCIIGLMVAIEVIKMITGIGRIQAGKRVLWDGKQGSVENFQVKKNPLCQVCERFKSSSYVNGNYYY